MPWRQLTLPLPELAAEDDLTRAPDGERIVTGGALFIDRAARID